MIQDQYQNCFRKSYNYQGDREGRPYNTTVMSSHSYIVGATLAVALVAGS
jgi:hypothetical protein